MVFSQLLGAYVEQRTHMVIAKQIWLAAGVCWGFLIASNIATAQFHFARIKIHHDAKPSSWEVSFITWRGVLKIVGIRYWGTARWQA